jgi:putative flippase GtrA
MSEMKWKRKMRRAARIKAFYIFARAQVSSFIGGVSDYLMMIALTEWLGIHYAVSILMSGALGAGVNFTINRYWAFNWSGHHKEPIGSQLIKFIAVVVGSIFLKSSGTFLLTSFLSIDYRISRLFVELIVSYGFNYVLMRYWVFKLIHSRSI